MSKAEKRTVNAFDAIEQMANQFKGFDGKELVTLEGEIDRPFRLAMANSFEEAKRAHAEAIKNGDRIGQEDSLNYIQSNSWLVGVAAGFTLTLLLLGYSPRKIARMARLIGIRPLPLLGGK